MIIKMKSTLIKKSVSYVLMIVIAISLSYSFYHRGIKVPVRNILNMTENDRRGGDFWGAFPAPFVERYNPSLDDRTIVRAYDGGGRDWAYGPIMHLITLPLTFMKSIKLVSLSWLLCNYAFLAIALWLILKMFKDMPATVKLIVIFLWAGCWPLHAAIQEDVIEIFELLMVVVSLYFLYKERDVFAGISMGVAAMAKFLPVIFLAYFLIKGKMKAFFAMLVTVLAIITATQFTLGWQNNSTIRSFLAETFSKDSGSTYWRSQTISSAIERIFSSSDYSTSQIYNPIATRPMLAKNILRISIALMALGAFFLIYKRRKEKYYGLDFSILSLLMVLISTRGQPYYLIFGLIGYAFAAYYLVKERYRFGWVILGISFFLSGYIMQMREFDRILLPAHTDINREVFFLFLSFPVYGELLLFMLLLVLYAKTAAKTFKEKI